MPARNLAWLRDLTIILMAVGLGWVLVSVGSGNTIEVLVTLLVFLVPLIGQFLIAKRFTKPDFDR